MYDRPNTIWGLYPDILAVVLSVIGLSIISFITLSALEAADLNFTPSNMLLRQIIFFVSSIILAFFVITVGYLRIGRYAYLLFFLNLLLLVLLVLLGKAGKSFSLFASIFPNINGAYRWIRLGPIQFQPSEFLKVTYILALARFLRFKRHIWSLHSLLGLLFITVVASILILLEPDLGTVMLLVPTLLLVMFLSGVSVRNIAIVVLIGIIIFPFVFASLRPYQRSRVMGVFIQSERIRRFLAKNERIKNFLWPSGDLERWYLSPEGYQLYHSKMAIGSAPLINTDPKGSVFLAGIRRFPHSHNDFIFPMIIQRFGIIGGYFVLLLYFILFLGLIEIAARLQEPFGKLIVLASLSLLFVQTFVNIAMSLGLVPITGVTLPFVSYGGSSLLSCFVILSLCISAGIHSPPVLAGIPFEAGYIRQ